MKAEIREKLSDVLKKERWPSGWHERRQEMKFAQRLFNSLPVRYDRRKVLRYIANEFPLSLSVNYRVLKELHNRMPHFQPEGIVDFGSGPGCAILAALEVFNKPPDTLHTSLHTYHNKIINHDSNTNTNKNNNNNDGIVNNKNTTNDQEKKKYQSCIRSIFPIEPSTIMKDYAKVILQDVQNEYHVAWLNNLKNKAAQQPLVIASFVLNEISGGPQVIQQ
ncbi:hypothetical protein RFI_20417, partial [Reticulomyxa filosa]